jgi:hypothetical protein
MTENTSQEAGVQAQPESTTENVDAQLQEMQQAEHEVQQPEGGEGGEQGERAPIDPAKKMIPLAALREEREARRQQAEKLRVMEERFAQLSQVVTQRFQQPKPEVPAFEVNPAENLRHENQQLREELKAQGATTQQIAARLQAEDTQRQVTAHVGSQLAAFAQTKPDVFDAMRHLQDADVKQLVALGHDPAAAKQISDNWHNELVYDLTRKGANVAERVYALAQAKGYQPKAAGDGQSKLESLARGTAAARSLGGGGSTTQKLSLRALAEMPAAEFEKAIGSDDDFRKLMGG